MMENSITRLSELRGSGYEIVDGQPDIIGWTIKDHYNHKIGVVHDLLFDPEQQKVRYIIANLKDNNFDLEKRKVVIPIGIAELHETSDDVILPSIVRWQLRALPTYSQNMTDYDERDVYNVFSSHQGATMTEDDRSWHKPADFYNNPSYNYDNLFRNRINPEQKDKPVQRTLRMRPGATPTTEDYHEREADPGRSRSESHVYETDSVLATHNSDRRFNEQNARQNVENESVLSRIHKLQQELGEIERDLRNDRNSR